MNVKRSVMLCVVTASTLLVFTACSSSKASSGGGGGGSTAVSSGGGGGGTKVSTVTVGVIEDFSGAQSPLGTADLQGVEQAVDEINAAGGIKSLGGAKVAIKKYDTETNPDDGVTAATKAVADKVNVVIGGEISDTVIAGTNVTHRAGIPWIITGGTAAEITERGYNDLFQFVATTDQAAVNYFNVMKYVAPLVGITDPHPTMGLSVSDTTYGNDLDAGFTKANASHYFNIQTKGSYPLTTTDLSAVATKMVSTNPEVLFNEGYPTDGLTMGKLFHDNITTTAKIFLSTATYSVVVPQLGTKANGMIMASGPSPQFAQMPTSFTTQDAIYKAKYNTDMPQSAVSGYQEMMFAAAGFEKAGTTNGPALAAALHQVTLTHDTGLLWPQDSATFTSAGTLTQVPVFYVQVQNGVVVGIYPPADASAKPIPFR
jgi:branched-chain amino acid transport system substrate-binding protein